MIVTQHSRLVFFPLACDHVVRMVRVLQLSRGHVLSVRKKESLEIKKKKYCIMLYVVEDMNFLFACFINKLKESSYNYLLHISVIFLFLNSSSRLDWVGLVGGAVFSWRATLPTSTTTASHRSTNRHHSQIVQRRYVQF